MYSLILISLILISSLLIDTNVELIIIMNYGFCNLRVPSFWCNSYLFIYSFIYAFIYLFLAF